MSIIDPLDGLEARPLEAQVAVLANEVRNQRNALVKVEERTAAVQKALWYLIASIIVGIAVFVLTTTLKPTTNPPSTPASSSTR